MPEIQARDIAEKYGRLVSSICRRMIQNENAVEDATQEVWLEILKSLPTFAERSSLSTWIYSVTSRVALNYARKERVYSTRFLRGYFHGDDIEVPCHPDFDKDLWVREMCDKCLTGILRCLDSESRLAYIFRDIACLPYSTIAEILEKDEATVRQVVSRSRRRLKYFLKGECVLENPNATCKCRMNRWVSEIDLPGEYARLRKTVHRINLYRASEAVLPHKDFWKDYI